MWLEFGPKPVPVMLVDLVRKKLEASEPPFVWGGPISLQVNFDLWGGGEPITSEANPAFAPAEWRRAVERIGAPADIETVLDAVWPE